MTLPTDRDARNALPVWDAVIAYFPDCWAEIAKVSVLGNKQHNLGDKLYFNRKVSTDHANKVMRHMLDDAAGIRFDEDGTYHLAKAAWRALAALQVAIECSKPAHDAHTKAFKESVFHHCLGCGSHSARGSALYCLVCTAANAVEQPPGAASPSFAGPTLPPSYPAGRHQSSTQVRSASHQSGPALLLDPVASDSSAFGPDPM